MIRWFGRALRGWRAGPGKRVAEDPRFSYVPRTLSLRSPGFVDGGPLPAGKESPPLAWTGIPENAATLAIVVEDVDVPFPSPLAHAVAYAMDPHTTALDAGAFAPPHLTLGHNGVGGRSFLPPTPLPGHGPHRYVFTLLALDYVPRFDQAPSRARLLDAAAGHVLALGEITGTRENR